MKECPECKGCGNVGCMEICPDCDGTGKVSFTQGDRIREMNDEQLAELLHKAWRSGVCCANNKLPCAACDCDWNIDLKRCSDKSIILTWLKREV